MEGMLDAAHYDRRVLVEMGLEKPREIEMSVLGNDDPVASLPGEVIPHEDFYTYHAKYQDDSSELIIPAAIPESLVRSLQEIAVRAYRAIDCAGMARVDFFVDRQTNAFYLGEINTIPGFTRISMYPKLWAAVAACPTAGLLDQLITLAWNARPTEITSNAIMGGPNEASRNPHRQHSFAASSPAPHHPFADARGKLPATFLPRRSPCAAPVSAARSSPAIHPARAGCTPSPSRTPGGPIRCRLPPFAWAGAPFHSWW